MSNPIDDAIDALNIDSLNEVLCKEIHPIVTRIMMDAMDDEKPFDLMPDVEKQISHCVTTEMMKIVLVAWMEQGGLETDDLNAIFMTAVRVGFLTKERYLESAK